MWSLDKIKFKKFNYLIDKIICQSKNIPISQTLIKNICDKFKQNSILKYDNNDLKSFGIKTNTNYQLIVYITSIKNVQKIFQQYPLKYQKQQIQNVKYGLSVNYAIYLPIIHNNGCLLLNFNELKNQKNNIHFFTSVIAHQLTHYFQNNNNNFKQWYQIFSNKEQFTILQQKAIILLYKKYNIDLDGIAYLTSKKQFQAFYTSIQKNKNLFLCYLNIENKNISFLTMRF